MQVESRFRFLAADSACLLQGKRPGYRQTLLAIRDKYVCTLNAAGLQQWQHTSPTQPFGPACLPRRFNVPCSSNLSTFDLETEIFMHVMNNCLELVQVGTPCWHHGAEYRHA